MSNAEIQQLPFSKRSDKSLIGLHQVLTEVYPGSRSSLLRGVKSGALPKPIRPPGTRLLMWPVGVWRKWIEAQQ